jgi:hypothetical protein
VLFILLNHYFSRTSFLSIYILSEDDCLHFSYSSVYPIIPQKQYNFVTVHGSRPAPEVPVNQSSISCNDQGGQINVINDSIQQTTQFPTSFPETMVSTHAYSNLLQCPLNWQVFVLYKKIYLIVYCLTNRQQWEVWMEHHHHGATKMNQIGFKLNQISRDMTI